MAEATPKLPPPCGVQSPDDHRNTSVRFLDQATRALNAGRKLHATENLWAR